MSLESVPWIRRQAQLESTVQQTGRLVGLPRGSVRGRVVSVDDPEERGRVKVIFDSMNPEEIPQVEESGDYSIPRGGVSSESHWIDTSPAFEGKQPSGLVGKRVNIAVTEGEYYYAVLNDVIYDPETLVKDSAKNLKMPNNSTMTRVPVYKKGEELPPANAANHGCMIIEEGGPMNSDWTCVCLKRDGEYIWVRHGDLAHGHAGGNDVTQQVDAAGIKQSPGQVASIWDHVFPTSHKEMVKWTSYFSGPAGNPFGENSRWQPPPGSDKKPLDFYQGELFDQLVALGFSRENGYPETIAGSFFAGTPPQLNTLVEGIPGDVIPKEALQGAQKALKVAENFQQAIENPTKFVTDLALKNLEGYIPGSTKYAMEALTNPLGFATSFFK